MPHSKDDHTLVEDREGRRLVVVIGTGRSGTSVATKILGALGVRIDTTLHRPNDMNPDGYFEDRVIVDANREMMSALSLAPPHVPPHDTQSAAIQKIIPKLRSHLDQRLQEDESLWGFKDPRTSVLLPHYRRLFQAAGAVPSYLFCARSGAAIVESLMQATRLSRPEAEQFYITRSLMGLRDCSANCYVLQYESLVEDPVAEIQSLGKWLWPDTAPPVRLEPDAMRGLVEPTFNRAVQTARPLENPLAQKIDALLSGISGARFDRGRVLAELREIDLVNEGYLTWLKMIARRQEQEPGAQLDHRDDVASAHAYTALSGLGESVSALTLHNRRLVEQLKEEQATTKAARKALNEAVSENAERSGDANEPSLRQVNELLASQLAATQAELLRLREEHVAAVDKARIRLTMIADRDARIGRLKSGAARAPQAEDKPSPAATNTQEVATHQRAVRRLTEMNKQGKKREAELTAQLKEMRRQHAQLRTTVEKRTKQISDLQGSRRYLAGLALVDGVQKPGWNTLAMPWRILRVMRKRTNKQDVKKQ